MKIATALSLLLLSAGMLAAVSSVPVKGELVVARNCHKSVFDGLSINGRKVHYLYPEEVLEGSMIYGGIDPEAVEKMLPMMKDASYITIFYGEDVAEWEAGKVENMIRETAPDAEVVLARGGQPLYDYIISVE
jgi:arginine/lysine/ornithine decarboxylase